MKRRSKFTIYHAFAVSLVLHAALSTPFVLHALASPPDDDDPTLVIELQGVTADTQNDQKVLQEIKGAASQQEADTAKPAETTPKSVATSTDEQPQTVADDGTLPPPASPAETPPSPTEKKMDEETLPPPTPPVPTAETTPSPTEKKTGSEGAQNNVAGAVERQNAQKIAADRDEEADRLRDYVKVLVKKVQANLVYPDQGRRAGLHGTATVSFTILSTGQIRQETLKIVESSGQPDLDASALKTIHASVPFAPPPQEITVAIAVGFGRKS
jgi:protein TonB